MPPPSFLALLIILIAVAVPEVVAPAATQRMNRLCCKQQLGLKLSSGTPPAACAMTDRASSVMTATAVSLGCEYHPLCNSMSSLRNNALWLPAKLLALVNFTCRLNARSAAALQGLLQQIS